MSKTGVHFDAYYEQHDPGDRHPESAERYQVLREALEKLDPAIARIPGRRAKAEDILLVHEPYYHDIVLQDVEFLSDKLRTGDTGLSSESYEVTMHATGAVLAAVDAVMSGDVDRVFCAIRPPGHHATADRGMGFCIFNHVAIAARYLQKRYGLQRIAILDWDVHHGNGTEAIFWKDDTVFFASTHEQGIFPYSGASTDQGEGAGEGFTMNFPLRFGSRGDTALTIWDQSIAPALEKFRPEFILISAGFDAREGDPIGGLEWTDNDFRELTKRAVRYAERWSRGRLVSVLEGGYNPPGLASAAIAHVEALKGE